MRTDHSLPHLRVRFVPGLTDAAVAQALALIWNPGEVVVDAALRESRSLPRVLWHESLHHRFVRAHGMTWRAGIRNMVLDMSNRFFALDYLAWVALGKPVPTWEEVP